MTDALPKRLSDLVQMEAEVRIVCSRCRFEEDWTPQALARHLAEIGGGELWSEITCHLRCRSFGCGSTNLLAYAVPLDRRAANTPRRIGRLDTHLLAAALGVLEAAAAHSRGQAIATTEVRLALLVVHRYARDRNCVQGFWLRASRDHRTVDDGLAEPLQLIRQRLVAAGWLVPSYLLEPSKTWPWNSPPPPGWKDANASGLADDASEQDRGAAARHAQS